jgi:hypothetical protein
MELEDVQSQQSLWSWMPVQNLLQDDKVRIASMRQQRKINDADVD